MRKAVPRVPSTDRAADRRKRQITLIHVARSQLGLDDEAMLHQARQTLLIAAARLEPERLHGAQLADSVLLMQCRPLVVDLLIASGMDAEAARTALPEVN